MTTVTGRSVVAHALLGCRTDPLGSYLQALGVLRLVAEQADRGVTGHWDGAAFILNTTLERDELITFFLDRYAPTPLLSPWNGSSGFDSNTAALEAIEASTSDRLTDYRHAIVVVRRLLSQGETPQDKADLVRRCRGWLPDNAVRWLDTAVVLTTDGLEFPPLLGSGGNDGRLEFSNNFMQRLVDVLYLGRGRGAATRADSKAWLRHALWEAPAPGRKAAVGQFDPGAAGGNNSAATGRADSVVNPWRYVLALEGALLFASSVTRRLEAGARGRAAMPFTFNTSPYGYSSGSAAEESRGELWTPVWERPAGLAELSRLFAEGRCTWRGRSATTALDAAKAATAMGVDRGITAFGRHVFARRFGRSFVSVSAGRLPVHAQAGVAELAELDGWLARVRSIRNPPRSVEQALRDVDAAAFDVTRRGPGTAVQHVLVAAARLQRLLGLSERLRTESGVPPVSGLSAARWLPALRAGDGNSAELRLALAIASQCDLDRAGRVRSTPRMLLSTAQVRPGDRPEWVAARHDLGLGIREVTAVLADARKRRVLEVEETGDSGEVTEAPGVSTRYDVGLAAPRADLRALILGSVDTRLFADLLAGCLLLDFDATVPPLITGTEAGVDDEPLPMLDLLAPFEALRGATFGLPAGLVPSSGWPAMLAAGRTSDVARAALHRLRVAGLRPRLRDPVAIAADVHGHRLSAALFTSIPTGAAWRMLRRVADDTDDTDE